MPEAALDLLRLDFEVADRGLELGVPVHQPLVAVDQALGCRDRRTPSRTARVKCGSMVNCSRLQSIEQPSRRSWRVIVPPLSAFHSQTLSTKSSRGVVGALVLAAARAGARPPSGSRCRHGRCRPPTAHPCRAAARSGSRRPAAYCRARGRYAGEPVTLGGGLTIVKGSGVGPLGAEQAPVFPMRIPFRLDRGGVECLVQLVRSSWPGLASGSVRCKNARARQGC